MKGVVSVTIWNVAVIGIIALMWVFVWTEFVAGKQIGSLTFGRA